MLEGVNVVETITRPSVPWYIIAFVVVLGCLILADFIVTLVRVSKGKKHDGMWAGNSAKFAIVGYIVLLECTIFAGIILYNGHNTIETTYRVTIDESVSLVEFREHYEILLEDENEYIIKEIAKTEDN